MRNSTVLMFYRFGMSSECKISPFDELVTSVDR